MDNYSVGRMSPQLVGEISDALKGVGAFGSVEIYVQKGIVTQISSRKIKKTHKTKRVNRL